MSQTREAPEPASPAQPSDPDRTRTHSWADQAPTLAALPRMSGVELLASMLAGELPPPPIMQTLGVEAWSFDLGRAVFTLVPAEYHYNPLGSVHGGVIAALLDSAAGCAVHSLLPAGTGYTSVDLVTRYLRPVTVRTGRVSAEGTVISRGSRTALAQAQLTDERGRLLAHATSTCLLFPIGTRAPD
jgi:uncharacterized protein (TIGR00369 family)